MDEKTRRIDFPPKFAPAQEILKALEDAGYAAYFVGGCVRDVLLGEEVSEIDIVTDANAEIVARIFPDAKPIFPYHYSCFRMKREGLTIELARMRRDVIDFGRQSLVSFVSDIHVDLARRDLTVNAICADNYGMLIDDFGGIFDLCRRRIVVIGQPETRFEQDCLRMLRVLRFAAKLDFSIDEAVDKALLNCQALWLTISPASAWREFAKLDRNLGKFRNSLVFYCWFCANFKTDTPNFLFPSELLNSIPYLSDKTLIYNMFFHLANAPNQIDVLSRLELPRALRRNFVENTELIERLLEYSKLTTTEKAKITKKQNSQILAKILHIQL